MVCRTRSRIASDQGKGDNEAQTMGIQLIGRALEALCVRLWPMPDTSFCLEQSLRRKKRQLWLQCSHGEYGDMLKWVF